MYTETTGGGYNAKNITSKDLPKILGNTLGTAAAWSWAGPLAAIPAGISLISSLFGAAKGGKTKTHHWFNTQNDNIARGIIRDPMGIGASWKHHSAVEYEPPNTSIFDGISYATQAAGSLFKPSDPSKGNIFSLKKESNWGTIATTANEIAKPVLSEHKKSSGVQMTEQGVSIKPDTNLSVAAPNDFKRIIPEGIIFGQQTENSLKWLPGTHIKGSKTGVVGRPPNSFLEPSLVPTHPKYIPKDNVDEAYSSVFGGYNHAQNRIKWMRENVNDVDLFGTVHWDRRKKEYVPYWHYIDKIRDFGRFDSSGKYISPY